MRRAFRYARTPEQAAFLDAVATTSGNRVRKLNAGGHFFRAQLGHGWTRQEIARGEYEEFPGAYDRRRMIPDAQFVGDGRVNANGIVCLYLATNEETAALEVRPLIGMIMGRDEKQVAAIRKRYVDETAIVVAIGRRIAGNV